jgi:pantetheine-phosphate adenylyltransferase
MKSAIYPGSFDPLTNGHLDIVERSLQIVDKLIIAVLVNSSKKQLFSVEERVELIKDVLDQNAQVEVLTFSGLLVDFCRHLNVNLVIRGLRAVSDFDYEHAMYLMNQQQFTSFDTIFLMAKSENSFISSSMVKEVAALGGDIEQQVPQAVLKRMQNIYNP